MNHGPLGRQEKDASYPGPGNHRQARHGAGGRASRVGQDANAGAKARRLVGEGAARKIEAIELTRAHYIAGLSRRRRHLVRARRSAQHLA